MKTLSGVAKFSRPVVKSRAEDHAFRVTGRVLVGAPIGNKPRGAYFTSVSREFVFLVAADGKQAH